MSLEQPTASANLIERAKNIILTPRAEWDRIAPEPANHGAILMGYWLPLAALAVLAAVVGQGVFGIQVAFMHMSVSWPAAISGGVLQLVFAVCGLYLGSYIVSMLAPNFSSTKDFNAAFKLTAYSQTALLLAGLFAIYPPLGALGILGLYSIVLFYLGLPRVLNTPDDKRIGYMAAIVVTYIVIGIVFLVVMGALRPMLPGMGGANPFGGGMQSSSDDTQIKIGGVTINSGDVDRAASDMEKAFSGMSVEGGGAAAVDPASLQALLPESLGGGWSRLSISSSTAGAMGMGASQAEATYGNGDARINVTLVHLGAMGGFASMAAAAGVQATEETADGYSRTRTVDQRVYTETLSRSANTAGVSVIGRNGATLTVEGSGGATPEQVRAVADAIGIARVEAVGQ